AAAKNLAIDEKRRRGIDAELHCPGSRFLDARKHALIRQALVEALLGETRLSGDAQHRLQRFLHHPVLLLREQGLNHREILILAGATREHGPGRRQGVEWELAEDEANLPAIDVFP